MTSRYRLYRTKASGMGAYYRLLARGGKPESTIFSSRETSAGLCALEGKSAREGFGDGTLHVRDLPHICDCIQACLYTWILET